MISRHIIAAEVQHQQKSYGKREREIEREREREREREEIVGERLNVNEKEKDKNPSQQIELGIFSTMRFDTATSSFLSVVVIKSYRKKLKLQNPKESFNISQ